MQMCLLGPAHENTILSTKASFQHPSGIDILKIVVGKNEQAYVCDKGNSCIRFITNVHSFNGDKFIGKVKIHGIPLSWKPEALTVMPNAHTIAISESSKIFLLSLDDSLISGQLRQVIDNLNVPCGLCVSPRSTDSILVADGNSVLEINLANKCVDAVAGNFRKAFDISVSSDGTVAVTDVTSHKLHFLSSKQTGEILEEQSTIGSTNGCLDGPASTALLSEPTGICFDLDTAIICCFGGRSNGCIKLHTSVTFACEMMLNIRQIYDSIGFLPKAKQNELRQQQKKIVIPFQQGLHNLINSCAYLQSITNKRREYLHCATAGPEGTVYHISLDGFGETVNALETHMQVFETIGMADTINSINLYALLNESTKEHGFAKHKQSGQYRHPTKKQYVQSKGQHEIETIKKTCQCPHSYHTNTFSAYQPTHSSNLASPVVVSQYKTWSKQFHPKDTTPTADIKTDMKKARMLNVLTKATPTQNIRDLYRYKCGYGPCVLFQKDALLEDGNDVSRHYPDFEKLMNDLTVRRGGCRSTDRRVDSGDYLLVPGDILIVNPGVNNNIPSADKWWLLQVNKAHHSSKTGSACLVYGFWLDEQLRRQDDQDCRVFSLQSNPVKIYFGSIIKNAGTSLVIPASEITTGWRDGRVSYAFSNAYCARLDYLSDQHPLSLESNVSDTEESDSATEDESEDGENAEDHDVELTLLARKRVIRNSDGNQLTSYKDLAGIGRTARRGPRRQLLEVENNDQLVSAQRDNFEFE